MTTHELAKLLLAGPDVEASVTIISAKDAMCSTEITGLDGGDIRAWAGSDEDGDDS